MFSDELSRLDSSSILTLPHSSPPKLVPRPIFTYKNDLLSTFPTLFVNAFAGTDPLLDTRRFGGANNKHARAMSKILAGGHDFAGADNCKITGVNFMYLQQARHVNVLMSPEDPSIRIDNPQAAWLIRRGGKTVVSVRARGRIAIAFATTTDGTVRVGVAYCTSDAFNRRNFRQAALQNARGDGAIVMDRSEALALRIKLRENVSRTSRV